MGDEESRGLIKTPNAKPNSESDLAMAVVDILSCCDGGMNPNQAKLLKDMENRFQKKGNLVAGDEEQREQFSDEETLLEKISPAKWFRGSEGKSEKYVTRSSQFITELPVRSSSSKIAEKNKSWKTACMIVAVGMILIFAVVLFLTRVTESPASSGSSPGLRPTTTIGTQFTSDCTVVAKQENPSPMSQCACGGSIDQMSDQAKEKYDTLLYAFGAEYLHENEGMNSC